MWVLSENQITASIHRIHECTALKRIRKDMLRLKEAV
jgi:hypothetical protein